MTLHYLAGIVVGIVVIGLLMILGIGAVTLMSLGPTDEDGRFHKR